MRAIVLALLLGLAVAATGPPQHSWHLPLVGSPAPSIRYERVYNSTKAATRSILLTHTDKNVLAVIDPAKGAVAWRHQFTDESRPTSHFVCEKGDSIVTTSLDGVRALDATTGHIKWFARGQYLDGVCLDENVVAITSDSVVRFDSLGRPSVGLEVEDALRITKTPRGFAVLTDDSFLTLSSTADVLSTVETSIPSSFVLSSTALLSLSSTPGNVVAESLKDGQKTKLSGGKYVEIVDVGMEDVFVATKSDGRATVFGVGEQGEIRNLWEFTDSFPNAVYAAYLDTTLQTHIARVAYSPVLSLGSLSLVSLTPNSLSDKGLLTGLTFPYHPSLYGEMTGLAVETLPMKEDFRVPSRIVVTTESGVVIAFEGERKAWERDEAPTELEDAVKPLVIHRVDEKGVGRREALFERVLRHAQEAVRAIGDLTSRFLGEPIAVNDLERAREGDVDILASSKFRSLVALDARDGKTRWRFFVHSEEGEVVEAAWTSLWTENGEVVAIWKSEGKIAKFAFDALTGELKDKFEAGSQGTGLVEVNSGFVIQASNAIYRAPPADKSFTWVERFGDRLVGKVLPVGERQAVDAWSFVLPSDTVLLGLASPQIGAVASLGRVLGDRSTLTKYLNPSLLALSFLNRATETASVVLLDTISGSVVHTLSITGVDQSSVLKVVLRDHWLVATFESAEEGRLGKVVSVELFERPSGVFAFSQTFVTRERLDVKGVTSTKLGITSYAALFTNAAGQLVAIPHRMLDPRRPVGKPSKADQEEGLVTYEAVLPADGRWIVSYSTPLLGVQDVVAAPGERESESLVVATGLDVFSTRVSPSKSFDVLSETFNKFQLLVAVSGLSAALFGVRSVVKKRQLHQQWYPNK